MFFKDSCASCVAPFRIFEESTALPVSIFPAYIGSGAATMSLDASGMQSLNHGVQEAFGSMPDAGDMYFVNNRMIGDRISTGNILPYGWFSWNMQLDDLNIDAENLQHYARVWTREISLDKARVKTTMIIGRHIRLELSAWMPYGRICPIFEIRMKGYDYSNQPLIIPHRVKMNVGLNLMTRKNVLLYDKADFAEKLYIEVDGHELYKYAVTLENDCQAEPFFKDGRYGIETELEVGNEWVDFRCLFDFDGQGGLDTIDLMKKEHEDSWQGYYERIADFKGIGDVEEFLYNNSHYLLHSGFNYKYGLQIGTPFFFPWCWRGSTFWDSHFVMDALMRCNDKAGADQFVYYLFKSMRSSGKPFSWMFMYDGTLTVEDDRDIAPLVMCAHAMTGIKHYEYFGDEQMLKDAIYPICKRVTEFAVEHMFKREDDGKWIISMPVSNDVVDEMPDEINQTFTTLWFLVIIKKTLELGEKLGIRSDPKWLDIIKNHRIEKNDEEYLHCKGLSAKQYRWASWLPFLLYPTEALPFIDMTLFAKTREKYTYPELYMEKQGSYQPWTEFMEASSDFRRMAVEEGFQLRKLGLSHVFGPGYFSEIGPVQQIVGLPPYVSAHGTFLSSLVYQFVSISLWDQVFDFFVRMPAHYAAKSICVKRVALKNGMICDANYSVNRIEAIIYNSENQAFSARFPLPSGYKANDVTVRVNGKEAAFSTEHGIIQLDIQGQSGSVEMIVLYG